MFPINFNFPYRKKDGSVITMEKALDGAGADLDLIDLDDVAIQTPADNEGLVYNGSAQKWKNEPVVTGDLWAENAAHNLCPFPYYSGGTQIISNLTITVGSKGELTASGETDGDGNFILYSGTLKKNTYKFKFKGTFTGGNLVLRVYDSTADVIIGNVSGNNEITFQVDETNEDHNFALFINWTGAQSITISGRPLLKLVSDPSDVDAPYAMTNGELTEMFRPALNSNGLTPTYCSITEGGYYKIGNIVIVQMRISNSSDVQNRLISGFPPYSGVYNHVVLTGLDYETLINVPVTIDTDGILTVMDTTSNGVIITGCYII